MLLFLSAPSLKLIDLPGLDQRAMDDSVVITIFNCVIAVKENAVEILTLFLWDL